MAVIKSFLHPFWTICYSRTHSRGCWSLPSEVQPGPGSGLSQGCTETTTTGAVTPTANLELPICQMCKFLGCGWKRALGDHANSTQEIESLARTSCLCLWPVHYFFFNAQVFDALPPSEETKRQRFNMVNFCPALKWPHLWVVIIALYKLKYKGNLSDLPKS